MGNSAERVMEQARVQGLILGEISTFYNIFFHNPNSYSISLYQLNLIFLQPIINLQQICD